VAKEIIVFSIDGNVNTPKRVMVDIGTLIKTSSNGEEEWLLKFYTPHFSDNIRNTSIKSIYLDELSSGWYKSSGLVNNLYTITNNCDSLNVCIDGSQGIYKIVLDHNENLNGRVVAKDIESKIRNIPSTDEWLDNDINLSFGYTNCRVKYKDSKFYILSGSSGAYSGENKSSVSISRVVGDGAYNMLGFHLGINSEELDSISATESLLITNYTVGDQEVKIGNEIKPNNGDVFYITDDINEDYFVCVSGTSIGTLKVQTQAEYNYSGITHDYLAGQSKVQLVKKTDPDFKPPNYTSSLDDMIKWGISSIADKIDYIEYGV